MSGVSVMALFLPTDRPTVLVKTGRDAVLAVDDEVLAVGHRISHSGHTTDEAHTGSAGTRLTGEPYGSHEDDGNDNDESDGKNRFVCHDDGPGNIGIIRPV